MVNCPRCTKAVYFAEQITGPGGLWHKTCLTCTTCNKRLDAGNLSERELQPFCKTCYSKNFGPKGYGFGNGTMNQEQNSTPTGSNANLSSIGNVANSNPELYQQSFLTKSSEGLNKTPAKKFTPRNTEVCPKCEKQVYFAEQVIGPNSQKYHKGCFRCGCNKLLDSTNITEKEGVIYCKSCYNKNFGPKGYGFSGGSAFLSS